MVLNTRKRQVFKFVTLLILSLLILMILPDSKSQIASQDWCRQITYVVVSLLLYQLITLKWMMTEFRVLPLAFILVLYIFNFSQVALYGFDLEQVDRHEGFSSIFYFSNVPEAVDIALKSITGIYIALCFSLIFQATNNSKHIEIKERIVKVYRQPAVLLIFIVGFIADIICNVFVVLTIGYAQIDNVPYLNIVRYFSLLLPSAVVLIISDPISSLKKKQIVFVSFIAYKVICMLGGYRAYAFISILLAFYVYYKICEPFRIRFKHIIIGLVVIQLGSGLLAGIRDTRQQGVNVQSVLASTFDLNNNAVFSLLSDFGVTLSIISTVLDATNGKPIQGSYLMGSLTTIIPGASSLVQNTGYQNMEEELGLRNAGGSLIGDLVFDYGVDKILFTSIILGLLYGFIFEKFEQSIKNLSPFALAYLFPVLVDLIFCARSSLAKMPREIVWYFLLLGLFTIIIPRRSVRIN